MVFKGEKDPTSIPGMQYPLNMSLKVHPLVLLIIYLLSDDTMSVSFSVEWICWLNGQRKMAPTPGVNCCSSHSYSTKEHQKMQRTVLNMMIHIYIYIYLFDKHKNLPLPQEMAELEARREQVRQNVARMSA